MTPEAFRLSLAAESLKMLRPLLDAKLRDAIADMERTADIIDRVPLPQRREASEICASAAEVLLNAARSLASIDIQPAPERASFDPVELGALGHG